MSENYKIDAPASKKEDPLSQPTADNELFREMVESETWMDRHGSSVWQNAPIHAGLPNTDEFHPFADGSTSLAGCDVQFSALQKDTEIDETESSEALTELPNGSLVDGTILFFSDALADVFSS